MSDKAVEMYSCKTFVYQPDYFLKHTMAVCGINLNLPLDLIGMRGLRTSHVLLRFSSMTVVHSKTSNTVREANIFTFIINI